MGIITSPPKTTYLGRLLQPARLDRGRGLLSPPFLASGRHSPPPIPLWCAEPTPSSTSWCGWAGTFKHQLRRWGPAPLRRSSSYLSFSLRPRVPPPGGGGGLLTYSRDFLQFYTSSVVLETLVIIPLRMNKCTFSPLNKY
jgi:hypothetical protein